MGEKNVPVSQIHMTLWKEIMPMEDNQLYPMRCELHWDLVRLKAQWSPYANETRWYKSFTLNGHDFFVPQMIFWPIPSWWNVQAITHTPWVCWTTNATFAYSQYRPPLRSLRSRSSMQAIFYTRDKRGWWEQNRKKCRSATFFNILSIYCTSAIKLDFQL